jgi:hypothetical protein
LKRSPGFAAITSSAWPAFRLSSQQWYGDTNAWPKIFEANRNQIVNPNLIYPGQVLRVPQ